MNRTRAPFSIVSGLMLCSASLLVPIRQRPTWLQEWRTELWYVAWKASNEEPFISREVRAATFCLGAFHDALYLRRESQAGIKCAIRPSRSSFYTTVALFAVAILSFAVALLLPNVRSAILPSPYRDTHNLVLISPPSNVSYDIPQMRMRILRLWQQRTHHVFSDFAFYAPAIKQLRIASHHTAELRIARVSANLFPMLGIQTPTDANAASLPIVFVSPAIWEQELRNEELSPGSELKIGIRRAVFGGVLPASQWRLPGSFDAWVIEPGADAPAIPEFTRGYMVGRRITSPENLGLGEHWVMAVPTPGMGLATYEFTTVSSIDRVPSVIYIFTVLLALLALPATTSLPLGEYPAGSERLSWALRLRRWMFLAMKFNLLLPTIYFVPLDLAHALPVAPLTSQYIQIVVSFVIALFGFRWMLKDQRRRCPVCLCTLTHPARVGEPSRNFLAWSGTELICPDGHGLLHVPELPTSWFSTQRWLYLDSSWSGVFISNA